MFGDEDDDDGVSVFAIMLLVRKNLLSSPEDNVRAGRIESGQEEEKDG